MTETTKFEITEEFLRAIPKTDLHCHLDGSLRPSTILELAAEQGVPLEATDDASLRKALHAGEICDDLVDYLKAFDITCRVMQTETSLKRVAFELAEDAARRAGAPRAAPRRAGGES